MTQASNLSALGSNVTTSGNLSSASTLSLQTNGTTAITVDTNQNVGIGTSSPAYKLDVTTTSNSQDAASISCNQINGTWFYLNNTATSGHKWSIASTGTGNGSGAGTLSFYDWTASAYRMVIDSSGNLLVGTTSFASASDTSNPATGGGIGLVGNSAGNVLNLKLAGSSGTIVNFTRGGVGIVGHIDITTTATSYVTSSDYRLKDNVVPMTDALDKLAQLKPVTYTWKSDNSAGQGFIAHELQAVVPDCVTGEKDAVDAEGKPIYQGIDTSFLVATLTAAIQEQQTIINDLKARITALEGAK